MATYIQLGKQGDILSILPILQESYRETRCRPALIVAKEYSEILLELDWLETIIWEGDWQDLHGALRFAKIRGGVVHTPQTHGKDFPIKREHPSFQLDQWDRCGRLKEWGTLPLTLPRREPTMTEIPPMPFILYCDHSQSSPFPHKEELFTILKETFPSHSIVRCSSFRLPRLLDLLALMDAADLIVCIESMHLHLSAATRTPVIALATDTPSRWHGSAFHPRMALHVRYGDYALRREELVSVAQRAVKKFPVIQPKTLPTAHKHAYNPSILDVNGMGMITYRWHPKDASWRTEIALQYDGKTLPVLPPKPYLKHSFEDGRLFMFKGKPHLSVTVSRSRMNGQRHDPCLTGYGELICEGDSWTLQDWIEPKHADNTWANQNKNVLFFEWGGRLMAIWNVTPNQVVLELDTAGNVVRSWKTPSPECSFGGYRGGTQPFAFNGNWLRFVHAQQVNKKSDLWWQYSLAAVEMESKPPFRVLRVSKQPILAGNELYTPDCKHWKPRICIPYGAVEREGGWLVSLGLNDCQCATVNLKEADLNL